ncbi:MAG: hypothetical protein F6K36_29360 [Symploca sp. SIO3C6]|nr:hypothetical protein [Symploca sp. SIO3C6]
MSNESNQSQNKKVINELNQSIDDKVSYSEKTSRLLAVSQLLKSISPLIWIVVIFVVIIKLWGTFSLNNVVSELKSPPKTNTPVSITIPSSINHQIDDEVIIALKNARDSAEKYASQQLDNWVYQLIERVDNDFLNWYFGYFTQLYFGAKGITVDVTSLITNQFDPNHPTSQDKKAESLTEEIQIEFTKRVLRPEIAQLKLERFTRETINTYATELSNQLAGIQSQYEIPQADWEKYLNGVSATILDSKGNNQNLSLRAFSRGAQYLVALPLVKATGKLGGGMVAKLAAATVEKGVAKATAKATTKLATKAAGKAAGKFSTATFSEIALNLIDPLAALGILVWDVWDHYHTVKIERPIMREAILEYLNEVKMALLYNPEDSIMSAIYHFEGGVIETLPKTTVLWGASSGWGRG